jgi:hypothetical protein
MDRDLLQYDWYARSLRELHPDLELPQETTDLEELLAVVVLATLPNRPVYLTDAEAITCTECEMSPEGVLYRVRTRNHS